MLMAWAENAAQAVLFSPLLLYNTCLVSAFSVLALFLRNVGAAARRRLPAQVIGWSSVRQPKCTIYISIPSQIGVQQ